MLNTKLKYPIKMKSATGILAGGEEQKEKKLSRFEIVAAIFIMNSILFQTGRQAGRPFLRVFV